MRSDLFNGQTHRLEMDDIPPQTSHVSAVREGSEVVDADAWEMAEFEAREEPMTIGKADGIDAGWNFISIAIFRIGLALGGKLSMRRDEFRKVDKRNILQSFHCLFQQGSLGEVERL